MDLMMFLVLLFDRSDDRSQGFDLRLPRLEFFRRKRITGGPYEVQQPVASRTGSSVVAIASFRRPGWLRRCTVEVFDTNLSSIQWLKVGRVWVT